MNPYPEFKGINLSPTTQVNNLKHTCWQEGWKAKEAEDKELYEALKIIQKWLLEDAELVEGKAQLYNKLFIRANNLAAKAIAKWEGK